MAGGFEFVEPIERAIRDEEAVVAVDRRGTDPLALDGEDAAAVLAGRFSDELLDPVAETFDLLGQEEGELVAAGERSFRHDGPEPGAGVCGRVRVLAGAGDRAEAPEHAGNIDAAEDGRDQAEVRQC